MTTHALSRTSTVVATKPARKALPKEYGQLHSLGHLPPSYGVRMQGSVYETVFSSVPYLRWATVTEISRTAAVKLGWASSFQKDRPRKSQTAMVMRMLARAVQRGVLLSWVVDLGDGHPMTLYRRVDNDAPIKTNDQEES